MRAASKKNLYETEVNVFQSIDRAIKECWLIDISSDYFDDYILLEDTLKNSLYHHLRKRLTDQFLHEHNLRIYTELHTGQKQRIDLAIVKINPNKEGHLRNKITEYVAVIELKLKSGQVSVDPFYEDLNKMRNYIKRHEHPNCQYYVGFIHETDYDLTESSWLHPKAQNTWAKGKLTELSAFYHQENMLFIVSSYNEMNLDLNSD